MRKFNVGDRVRIECLLNGFHGEETSITEVLVAPHDSYEPFGGGYFKKGETVYRLDLKDDPGAAMPARYLRPVYDGNELVSWSSCVWQPSHVDA